MTAGPPGPPLLGALMRMPIDIVRTRIIESLRAAGYDDVVPAHTAVLRYPGPNGERPGELAEQANMSKQAMNYLLGQLEGLGYIERRSDVDDKRSTRVYMTGRGEDARKVIRAEVRKLEKEWASELGEEDLEALRELLLRLNAVMRNGD